MFFYVLLLIFIFGLYLYFTKDHDYWKKKGVVYIKPSFIVGNMGATLTKKSFGAIITDIYREFKDEPFVGIFNMRQPVLLVRDLEIIRNVLVKQFSKFHDSTFNANEEADPIISKNPFFLKGEKWKIVRGQLTLLLTTSKMKTMYPHINETCKTMIRYLEETSSKMNDKKGIEAKTFALKFSTDNVASCGFGLQANSFKGEDSEFTKLASGVFEFNLFGILKFLFLQIFPDAIDIFKIPVANNKVTMKFKDIITDTVKYRQENKVVRHDFLDSVIELKSKPLPFDYTSEYMVAHALTFFIDGAETSAIAFSFALFELAVNLDVQNKLKDEITKMVDKHGEITFDAIQEMRYLDAVFHETLRKYPPVMLTSRKCTQDCDFTELGHNLKLEKGAHVFIPVFGLHRDPQYYPDPERFDPDRFTEDAKIPLTKNCFLSFGDGPRICLGQKFAIMQIKAGITAVIQHFEVRLNKEMTLPLEFENKIFILGVKDGIWLNFYKRDK